MLPALLWPPAGKRLGTTLLPPAAPISFPHPWLRLPHLALLTKSAATDRERTAKVVENEKRDPPQGTQPVGHHTGHGPLLSAMSGEPLVCRSKPEGSPGKGFQLQGAPSLKGGPACLQGAQSLMRETPHKEWAREEGGCAL